jgi:phosphoribosylformimino-5-aminoimidazole carboxamide ribotide isomerase
VAVLIPSIDLMSGKVVQLTQGEKKTLEFDDLDYWIDRFSKYPLVQLIDLDAAKRTGDNRDLVRKIMRKLQCQVGGGIRTVDDARHLLDEGARKIIIGSALLDNGTINTQHARRLADTLGTAPLIFALDSRDGSVATHGWRNKTHFTATDLIRSLEPFCDTFLYTNIDTEGMMLGIPMEIIDHLRHATSRRLVVAGGITRQQEIDQLDAVGVDAVVGMAIYTGTIPS